MAHAVWFNRKDDTAVPKWNGGFKFVKEVNLAAMPLPSPGGKVAPEGGRKRNGEI